MRVRRLGRDRDRGVGHRHRAGRIPGERGARCAARLHMREVGCRRKRDLAGNHQVGDRARGDPVGADLLRPELAHEVEPKPGGDDHGPDPVGGGHRQRRDRHLALPFRVEQVLVGLWGLGRRDFLGVVADAGIALAHADPVAARLDRGRLVIRRLRRGEGLQDTLVARDHQPVRSEFEGVGEMNAGGIFFQHLGGHVDRRSAGQLGAQIGIFLPEAVDQRLDLRAGGIDQQRALLAGALLQNVLAVGTGIVSDRCDRARLRVGCERPGRECRADKQGSSANRR